MEAVWPAFVVAVVVLIFVSMRLAGGNDPFKTAADSLNLNLTRSVPELLPRLEGMINGLPIRIDQATGEGVRYRVFYPPLGMALRLTRETSITRTMDQLGQADTQVGAKLFDDSFQVNTSRPDALRDMMTPELRRSLVQLIEQYPTLVVDDGGMTLLSDTVTPSAEELVNTTVTMASAAHRLVERRPPPLTKPVSTRPAATPTSAPSPPASQPDRTAESAAAEPTTAPIIPDPPRTEPPPPSIPPEPEPVITLASTGLPDSFFEDVFGANRLSFEAGDQFEEEFRGRKVTLSGTIKQSREVDQDFSVETGPAARTVVTVARIDNELYGATDIDAIVFLPAGSSPSLERGEPLRFEGTLEKVDPFTRNLFIVDATKLG